MCGTEHEKFGQIFLDMSRESDSAELQRLSEEFYDELKHTAVQIGIIDTPEFAIYNPDAIESWEMRPVGKGGVGGMRYLWRVNLK